MWSLFSLYSNCPSFGRYFEQFKITNMLDTKTVEQKAAEFSRKTDIRWNSEAKMFSYYSGYVDCQKEYEEKLRWIPVEESMPIEREIVIIKVNRRLTEKVTSTHIAIGECLINSFTGNLWIFDKSYSAGYVTHWRHIL